jgi:hypothetical protein
MVATIQALKAVWSEARYKKKRPYHQASGPLLKRTHPYSTTLPATFPRLSPAIPNAGHSQGELSQRLDPSMVGQPGPPPVGAKSAPPRPQTVGFSSFGSLVFPDAGYHASSEKNKGPARRLEILIFIGVWVGQNSSRKLLDILSILLIFNKKHGD